MPGWMTTSWNQDCWKKYQQPQIFRWYYANDRKQRGTKKPLGDSERGEWKGWLKILHSEKLRSWYLVPSLHGKWMGKKWQILFCGVQITVDSDCSHEIKRHLVLGRKAMTNLDSILESRGITLPTKVCVVKAMVFPLVMYGYEAWTIKKAEHWRNDVF